MLSIHSVVRAAALALVLGACAATPPRAAAPSPAPAAVEPASVLLVSLDAFRADYLDRDLTPNLSRFARDGVRAAWMTPSYPSLTFPNHYTLVTGLRPDHHGVVHNTMQDAALGRFKNTDATAVADGRWWGGEPIWVGAEKAGLATATLFWPGSSAAIAGVRPRRWLAYDESLPADARIDTVLGWLSEPAATRPRLVTLYLEAVDTASHDYGPDSPQTRASLVDLDRSLGRLFDGLAARGLRDRTNVVIVSDHGMATVAPGHAIAIEDMVEPADADAVSTGQSVGFVPRPGRTPAAEARLLGAHDHYDCWRKSELPARWHYGTHPRVPAIVCQMHEGWDALTRAKVTERGPRVVRGSHGYDPALPSMRAIFLAGGPAFRHGVALPGFDNVDVYPLLARLLGIPAAPNDGDIAPLLPALVAPGGTNPARPRRY